MDQNITNYVGQKWAIYLSKHKDQYPHIDKLSVSINNINYIIKSVNSTHEIYITTIIDNQDVESLWCVVDSATKEII